MQNNKVSFILLEYFSLEEINQATKKIHTICSNIDHEIIISSNSCYDKSKQNAILNNNKLDLNWQFNENNGGFAYGMNQGLKKAKGSLLIIANPDTIILNGLTELITFMNNNSGFGIVGPQLVDEKGIIQDSCRPYVSLNRFIWRQIKRILFKQEIIYNKNFDYSKTQTVDWVAGAFMVASRAAYELTGGLNEEMFMYAEDLDWCTRIREKGLEIVYFPKMKVQYKGSRAARHSKKYSLVFIKSHIMYWRNYAFFYGFPKRKQMVFG